MISIIVVKNNFDENVSEVIPVSNLTIEQFEDTRSSTLRCECTNDEWINLTLSLSNYSNIETIYYLSDQTNLLSPTEIDDENSKWVQIADEKQLRRNLLLKKMFYYIKKGLQLKEEKDFFQSNFSFDKAQQIRKEIQLTC